MIPILYNQEETQFTTNGVGRLSDAISCIVSEEFNGKYELRMKYSVLGELFQEIKNGMLIFAKPSENANPQPFEIYKITKPINGICDIYAEHISYRLAKIPVMPYTANNAVNALQGLKTNAAIECPFDFWTDKTIETKFQVTVPSTIRSKLGGEQGSILQTYKGEYEWDMFTVKLWTNRGNDNGVVIRYGKNLIDLNQEESISETYTGVCPYWVGIDENSNDVTKYLEEKVVYADNAESFPVQKIMMLDISDVYSDEPTEEEIRDYANRYIANNDIGVPKVSLKISFVSLWQSDEYKNIASLERVSLCDTVRVEFEKLGVFASAKVVSTTYNVLTERYEYIDIGNARTSIADTLAQRETQLDIAVKNVESNFERNINIATNKITGGLGGNIVINYNADGVPIEILIMDTDSISTATNVLRFNEAGIGFSQNGYNGPFTSAWTLDGTLDMRNINVVNLVADLIRGGTLKLGSFENESGVLELYNEQNELIGVLDKNGFKMYGENDYYVLMNAEVGFAGYDNQDRKIFWSEFDVFHMKKSEVEEEITLCNKIRFIEMTIYDANENVTNDGVGIVPVISTV